MNEQKIAKDLAESAINAMSYTPNTKFPCLSFDKSEYSKYDIEILTQELNNLGFTLVDMTLAPEPFNLIPIAHRKWFIYKK